MIALDTHIWVWWVHGDPHSTSQQNQWRQQYESQGLGVSAISSFENFVLLVDGSLHYPRLGVFSI